MSRIPYPSRTREARRRAYFDRKAASLCPKCGAPAEGTVLCDYCAEANRSSTARYTAQIRSGSRP